MSSDKSVTIDARSVVEAVDSLQSRKAKPDEQKIVSYLTRKHHIKSGDAKRLINRALADAIVVKVNYAESVSFRTPQKFGQMLRNHQNHIIPFDGSLIPDTAVKRVLRAIKQLSKSLPTNRKLGVTATDILNELHNTSQLLNYTLSLLERLLNCALKEGLIDCVENGTYILTESSKLDDTLVLNYHTDDNSQMESEPKLDSKEENTIPDGASLLATQSLSTMQKGKRKITVAPVMQRIRPMSKRKKFKKSLGPDFLEPADFGMQYLRDTFEPKCEICSLTSSSNTLDEYEELLHCNTCDVKAHPTCLNITTNVGYKLQWQCMNCKTCAICHQFIDNEFLLICINCNKGFHIKCHTPNIQIKSKGKWSCKRCTSNQTHLLNGVSEKKVLIFNDNTSPSNFRNDNQSEDLYSNNLLEVNEDNSELANNEIANLSFDENKIANQKSLSDKSLLEENINEQQNDLLSDTFIAYNEPSYHANSSKHVNTDVTSDDGFQNDGFNLSETNECQTNTIAHNLNCSLPESPQKWTVDDVENFIRDSGFPEQAKVFRDQEIDGRSLLLLRRMDVLTGLSLKLGPALKIYSHIMRLQGLDKFNY